MTKKKKKLAGKSTSHKNQVVKHKQPFIEHVQELRRRLYYVALSVILWGCIAYAVQMQLTNLLLLPSHGQKFIYTSPGGGLDFLFRVCIYGAIIMSLPVIAYNLLRFCEPIIKNKSSVFIWAGTISSGLLALTGMAFGYFLGLPAAIEFLMHQFTTVQIQPLVTIQSYLNFVVVYMVGSALLFQLPLIILIINRIKPLKPKQLLHYERWVIVIAFVAAALINPTPNPLILCMVAAPFILMYQVSIIMVAFINRPKKVKYAEQLTQYDQDMQTYRKTIAHSQPVMTAAVQPAVAVQVALPKLKPAHKPLPDISQPAKAKPPMPSSDLRQRAMAIRTPAYRQPQAPPPPLY